MISKKNKKGYWGISDLSYHRFSGPYAFNQYNAIGFKVMRSWHRLYGFSNIWGSLSHKNDWFVNGKPVMSFKGYFL